MQKFAIFLDDGKFENIHNFIKQNCKTSRTK